MYRYLRWVWIGLVVGLVVLPLAGDCVRGLVLGTGCTPWKPALAFVDTHYRWIAGSLALLAVSTLLSRESYRRDQARKSFDLCKPANQLHPKDLAFRVVKPDGEKELEEYTGLNRRPFYESTYVSRSAVLYERHVQQTPEPYYSEDDLVQWLRKGKSFVLIGPPADGKTRTLYEIISHMDDYEIVKLKVDDEIPEKDDLSLLFKESHVILLLDDLSNPENRELDLLEFGQRLSECEVHWAVAATCQDGPELTRVQTELGRLYDSISLKLWLVAPTPQQKKQLAESIWNQPWDPQKKDDYPTLGSIAMAEAVATMERRFDILSRNHHVWADTLRALKLLDYGGIPASHERIRAVLTNERLFQHSDLRLPESLGALASQGFLRPGSTDPVQAEPAYMRGVVTYTPRRELKDDLGKLADVLEELEDVEGLWYLGVACSENLGAHETAINYFDRALSLRSDFVEAIYSKGNALRNLDRYEEALKAYEAALSIEPDNAEALHQKGVTLYDWASLEEALQAFEAALRMRPNHPETLTHKGNTLNYLGRYEEALKAYEAALSIEPDNAEVLGHKGSTLIALGRFDEALQTFEAVLRMRPNHPGALTDKGCALGELERYEEALDAHEAALRIRPHDLTTMHQYADTLSDVGSYEKALDYYNRILKIESHSAGPQTSQGVMLKVLHRDEEALRAFEKALKISDIDLQYRPDDVVALHHKGVVLFYLERYEEAVETFDAALEKSPGYAMAIRHKEVALRYRDHHE